MTYQALARKWRPGRFADVVGQTHVVAALTHALDDDRVHHAFLFTGTRGVGKTTIARLLAKSLNCIEGVSAQPCGECSACTSVEQGRFVDLLEVDAASRTRVDDTRELLDNVQYAPTMGRYKVYLIDEVHMLSGHSFNALLKTLEEPPEHVKFLLATTDPQKLPPTILSRCLQFNLRALSPEEISNQLAKILDAESIDYEDDALALLARAANGSMRDALSLLDQSIAFSGANVKAESIRAMLGMIEGNSIVELVRALADADTSALFGIVDLMREKSVDFIQALNDLLELLYEIALYQTAPEVARERNTDRGDIESLAGRLGSEATQLFYQIALIGKRDLPLAPDPARGFEMILMRMLAFDPMGPSDNERVNQVQKPASAAAKPAAPTPVPASSAQGRKEVGSQVAPAREPKPSVAADPVSPKPGGSLDAVAWNDFVEASPLRGLVRELAMNLAFKNCSGNTIEVALQESICHMYNKNRHATLEQAIRQHFGDGYSLKVEQGELPKTVETPALQRDKRLQSEKEEAIEGLRNDPDIKVFIDQFDAEVVPDSVLPAKHRG